MDENNAMRVRSGCVDSNSSLVSFLYELMRDHIPAGDVEEIIRNSTYKNEKGEKMMYQFTNGWLANMAIDMAERLK